MSYIAPSILAADFARIGEEIQTVTIAGADWIHVDVMDGHFVPNITIGPAMVSAAERSTTLPIDVHLMIENPDRYIPEFSQAGADYICVHAETCPHLCRTIDLIRQQGQSRPAVALNPSTPLASIEWVLDDVAFVLLMSVNPGFGGQKFIVSSLKKIERLKSMIIKRGLETLVQVDGGINADTAEAVAKAGADCFVAGSAIFGQPDYEKAIGGLRRAISYGKGETV